MNIAIIGAGLTGMSAGLRLSQNGDKVTIYEKENSLGGLASAIRVGNETLDRFYHHIFVSDSEILDLIDELDLKYRLNWYEPKNAIYIDNYIHPFTSPLDLLCFKPLSIISRIRMGMMVLTSRFIKDYSPFESITAKEWIIKRSGQEVWQKVWEPLIKSKFDIDSNNISGTWIWNKLKLRGSSRGKSINKEMLGYLEGSFSVIIEKIAQKIIESGGNILLDNEVTRIIKNENGSFDIISNKNKASYDKVLFTCSPNLLAKILQGPDSNFKNSLNRISYKANLCLVLELTHSLSPYYWITVAQEDFPFVLIIEHTNLVGSKDYNSHVVYLSRYLDVSDPLYSVSDQDIINEFIKGLKKVFPGINSDNIKNTTISRAQFSQPVIPLGYSKIIPDIKTPIEGLFLASMSQIYPEDRGLNYAVKLGQNAANEILENL
ncbi:MAG: NAD(P)/FAD-dependent oxidoreductase [Clostridiaceae bacterium]|nr:NAD(P)/FAD-dependent oxidoreductase [Clostridiaceae bacterium]